MGNLYAKYFWVMVFALPASSQAWNSGVDWDEMMREAAKTGCILELVGPQDEVRGGLELERRVSLSPQVPARVVEKLIGKFGAGSTPGDISIAPAAAYVYAKAPKSGSGFLTLQIPRAHEPYVSVRHLRERSIYYDNHERTYEANRIAYRSKSWTIPGETRPRVSGYCLKKTLGANTSGVDRDDFIEREETFLIVKTPGFPGDIFKAIQRAAGYPEFLNLSHRLEILTEVFADRLGVDLVWNPTQTKIGYIVVDAYNHIPLPEDIATAGIQTSFLDPIRFQYEIELLPAAIPTYLAHKEKFKRFLRAVDQETGGAVDPTPKYLHFSR